MFLISDAAAQTAATSQAQGGLLASPLFFMVIMGVMMYFLMIRPQSKRAKEHKALLDALAKGDEVVTQGGMMGTVTEVLDDVIKIEVSSGVEIKFQKAAVVTVLLKKK